MNFVLFILFNFIFFYFIFRYLFIYLFIPFSPLLVCFGCFCFVAVDFVFIFYWPIFCCVLLSLSFFFLFFSLFVYFTCSFNFIVGGAGCRFNLQLVGK